jgi:hypothetical protein
MRSSARRASALLGLDPHKQGHLEPLGFEQIEQVAYDERSLSCSSG